MRLASRRPRHLKPQSLRLFCVSVTFNFPDFSPMFDFSKAREAMVEQQIRPWDVLDVRVLETLLRLPRETFVTEAYRTLAYADLALPIGHGQTMMKPVVEGRTLQALDLRGSEDVLEIGTGSGFLSACLATLARSVISIEQQPDFIEPAHARLAALGLANVQIEHADALAWQPAQRFDAICVTGAVDAVPPQWCEWLRPGGRMFVVRGRAPAMEAVLVNYNTDNVNAAAVQSLFETELAYLAGAAPVPEFTL